MSPHKQNRLSLAQISLMKLCMTAILTALSSQPSLAQSVNYPTRMVRFVVPLPPGAVNDAHVRLLSDRLSKAWGQPIVVENRPGANTIIGTDVVAKAPADGYTLLATISTLAHNAALRKKLPYDTLRDLTPITQLNRVQLVLYVRADLGVSSVEELVAYAKANPGKLNFATFGVGSSAHLLLEKFRVDKGALMTHLPFKGAAEVTQAVVANIADVGVSDLLSPADFFETGRLRPIAVTGLTRVSTLKNVETLSEAGISGFEGYSWLGLFAPAGTPPEIVQKIATTINQVQSDSTMSKHLVERLYVEPSYTTTEEFAKILRQDIATTVTVVRETGVTLDPE